MSYIQSGYHLTTDAVAASDSFAYWREVICNEYVQLDCERRDKSPAFYGEVRGGLGLGGLCFSEVQGDSQDVIRSRPQIAKANEASFLMSFQLHAKCCLRQGGRQAVLNPGDFAMYSSEEPYSLTLTPDFHQIVVKMPAEVLSQHLLHPEQYTALALSAQQGLGAVLSQFLFSLVKELDALTHAPLVLQSNLLNLIALAFSSSALLQQIDPEEVRFPAIKRRILSYIEQNLCDPDLNNEAIADAQHISIRYLQKLFEGEEQSIRRYILNRRLDLAKTLLIDQTRKHQSIETIALSTGFSSAGHFSRSFKHHFGYNPSELRLA